LALLGLYLALRRGFMLSARLVLYLDRLVLYQALQHAYTHSLPLVH
jgi:hypothetical protein